MPLSILGISWNVITVTSMMYIRVAAIDSVDGFTGVKVQHRLCRLPTCQDNGRRVSKRHAKVPVLKNISGFEKPFDFCHLSKVILEVFL